MHQYSTVLTLFFSEQYTAELTALFFVDSYKADISEPAKCPDAPAHLYRSHSRRCFVDSIFGKFWSAASHFWRCAFSRRSVNGLSGWAFRAQPQTGHTPGPI